MSDGLRFGHVRFGASLVITPNRKVYLIDGGYIGTGASCLLAWLRAYANINPFRVDGMFLTHYHENHSGGLLDVVRSLAPLDRVGPLYSSGVLSECSYENPCKYARDTQVQDWLIAGLAKHGIPHHHLKMGDKVDLGGGVVMDALGPREDYLPASMTTDDPDDRTGLSLRFTYGQSTLIHLGDQFLEDVLNIAADHENPKATVLVAPHHGGPTYIDNDVLAAFDPDFVVLDSHSNGATTEAWLTGKSILSWRLTHGDPNASTLDLCVRSDGTVSAMNAPSVPELSVARGVVL